MSELAALHLRMRAVRIKQVRAFIRAFGANLPTAVAHKIVIEFENFYQKREPTWPEERRWLENAAGRAVDAYKIEKRDNPALKVEGTIGDQERKIAYVENQLANMKLKLQAMRDAQKRDHE